MPDRRGDQPLRIGVIAHAVTGLPVQRDSVEEMTADELLLRVLAQLGELVRAGNLIVDPSDGVLLDAIIGDVRCVLVQQRPSIEVGLSPREQQVARMVANGRTNQAIAAALEISVWTVSTHLRRIFAKLAVSSRAEMVAHLREQSDFAALVDQGDKPTRRS